MTSPTGPAPSIRLDAAAPLPAGYDGELPDGCERLTIVAADVAVGVAVIAVQGKVASLREVWVVPAQRRRGVARAALAEVRTLFAERGVLGADAFVRADNIAAQHLLAGGKVNGFNMIYQLPSTPTAVREGFGFRPLTADEYTAWEEHSIHDYAEACLPRSGGDWDSAMATSRRDFARLLPEHQLTPDMSIVALTHDGDRVGTLWLAHHLDGETYGYDLEVEGDLRGRGYGRAAMAVGEQLAAAAGDTRLGLHVFGDNHIAQTLYLSWGFTVDGTNVSLLEQGTFAPATAEE